MRRCSPFRSHMSSPSSVSTIWINARTAKQWLEQLGNPYAAVAFDTDGRTAINWGVYGAPETFLVDGQGRVIYKFISPMTPEVWEREFLPRIAAARRGGA